MKLEALSAWSPGFLAVAGSWLVANGSSWQSVVFALLGAFVAMLSMDPWHWKKGLAILIFNVIVAAFGVPMTLLLASRVEGISFDFENIPAGALIVSTFIVGWTAHHAAVQVRQPLLDLIVRALSAWLKVFGGTAK
jgi:hypothetical protein